MIGRMSLANSLLLLSKLLSYNHRKWLKMETPNFCAIDGPPSQKSCLTPRTTECP
uniref:Uncharacterized protein n=1 Tax=Romanomermis culicivorax TaxID=13658 RepID=A0A915K3V2_ROMCU